MQLPVASTLVFFYTQTHKGCQSLKRPPREAYIQNVLQYFSFRLKFLLFHLVQRPLQGCMCVNLTCIVCTCVVNIFVDCIKMIKSCILQNRNINASPVPHCKTRMIRESTSSQVSFCPLGTKLVFLQIP